MCRITTGELVTSATTVAPALTTPEVPPAASRRIQSVDAIRGLIMIIMALDHIRDFVNSSAMAFLPTDLDHTTAPVFLTRWITHFCAPVFAFTAGTSAFLWARRRTKAQLSRFLLSRGLWLILLELTVLRFILFLNFSYHDTLIVVLVIWMLGLSMVAMAGLVHLPARWLAALSIVTIAAHNLLDPIGADRFGSFAWLWNILHEPGTFRSYGDTIHVAYPLIPWVAVMALGYCFGPVLFWDPARRRRFLVRLGLGLIVAFFVLRGLNVYGDPAPWSHQSSHLFTALSFLNCTKYPPSLLFLLMTLPPALLAMAWLERVRLSAENPIIVFGRVPFFYYVVHLAVIHAVAIVLGFLRYGKASFLLLPPPSMGSAMDAFPANYGYSLWFVYAVWVAVIVMMYPMCRWFAHLKQRRHDWWLSYL